MASTFRRTKLSIMTAGRYSIVGVSVAGIYVISTVLLERAQLAPPSVNSAAAFLLAVIFQYIAQSSFTFKRPLKNRAQIVRFATTVVAGLGISMLVVSYVGPSAGLSTFVSSLIVTMILPAFNLVVFMLWVFVDRKSGSAA